jgi:hypothetical protein
MARVPYNNNRLTRAYRNIRLSVTFIALHVFQESEYRNYFYI